MGLPDPGTTQLRIDAMWDFDDPAASEARFRSAIGESIELAQQAELRTQLARAQALQRQFDKAHGTLNEVERSLHSHEGDPAFDEVRVRLPLERGRVFNSSGEKENALPLFERAWNAARENGNDHLAVDAAHMVAIVHGSQQRSDAAMQWNRHALELAESSEQARARQWRGSLHNNIGWTLHSSGRFEEALRHFEQALDARLEQGKPSEIRIARWSIARCLRSLGRLERALDIQRAIAEELRLSGAPPDGFVDEELGECLLALGHADAAQPHFAAAHALLSKDPWLVESEPHRIERLARLAGVR